MTNPSIVSKTPVSNAVPHNASPLQLFRSVTLQEWLTAALNGEDIDAVEALVA